jgi:hypothetical protein
VTRDETATDCGEHRQAAGAVGRIVSRLPAPELKRALCVTPRKCDLCINFAAPGGAAVFYVFPSGANSRNKILATSLGFDPPNVVVLLPRSVLTLTNPSRDVLYEPLTVRPRKSIANSFQMAKSLSISQMIRSTR